MKILGFLAMLPFAIPPIASADFEFAVSKDINDLCRGVGNSAECADKIEAYQLRKSGPNVSRDKLSLKIRIRNGKFVVLKDSQLDSPSVVAYRYIEYLPQIQYHSVLIHYLESTEVMLVSDVTGAGYRMQDVPKIAPDGRHIVATLDDDLPGDSGIHFFSVSSRGVHPEFSDNTSAAKKARGEASRSFGYAEVRWVGPNVVQLREFTNADPNMCPGKHFMRQTVRYRFVDGKWSRMVDRASVVCEQY